MTEVATNRTQRGNGTESPADTHATHQRPLPGASARSRFYCDISASGPTAALRLSGELGADTLGEFGAQLLAVIRTKHRHVLVDLSAVSHIAPASVGVFNRAAAELRALGGQLTLTGVTHTDLAELVHAGLSDAIKHSDADPRPGC